MRELKFRVWDIDLNKYIYDIEINWSDKNPFNLNRYLKKCNGIQQYIGLKDKNNKEIYEGDIVRFRVFNRSLEVYFDNEFAAFTCLDPYEGNLLPGELDEVIGNIYENPELLENV